MFVLNGCIHTQTRRQATTKTSPKNALATSASSQVALIAASVRFLFVYSPSFSSVSVRFHLQQFMCAPVYMYRSTKIPKFILFVFLCSFLFFCLTGIGQTTNIFGQLSSIGRAIVEEGPAARVRRDDDVSLTCVAEGSGELQYDWFHNGRKLAKSRASRILMLNTVSSAESGTYVCAARNAAGPSRFNAPFVLSVATTSRVLNNFVRETVAAVDTSIRLPCSFNPPAPVEWIFRGTALSSNKSSQ